MISRARYRFFRRSIPIEAAAPIASSPNVPGSGTELPPLPEPGVVGAGHIDGIHEHVTPACAAGAPVATKVHANKLNDIPRTVPLDAHRVVGFYARTAPGMLSACRALKISSAARRTTRVHCIKIRRAIATRGRPVLPRAAVIEKILAE